MTLQRFRAPSRRSETNINESLEHIGKASKMQHVRHTPQTRDPARGMFRVTAFYPKACLPVGEGSRAPQLLSRVKARHTPWFSQLAANNFRRLPE